MKAINLKDSKFENGIFIHSLGKTMDWEVYEFVRLSILDSKIPITKVIGFKIKDETQIDIANAIARHSEVLESMIEISKNLQNLVFVDKTSSIVDMVNKTGQLNSGNCKFICNSREIRVLDTTSHILTSKRDVGLRFLVSRNTGVRSMEDNVGIMSDASIGEVDSYNTYFPLYSYHNLYGSIYILPYMQNGVRYRLNRAVTDEKINAIWHEYIEELVENGS